MLVLYILISIVLIFFTIIFIILIQYFQCEIVGVSYKLHGSKIENVSIYYLNI